MLREEELKSEKDFLLMAYDEAWILMWTLSRRYL